MINQPKSIWCDSLCFEDPSTKLTTCSFTRRDDLSYHVNLCAEQTFVVSKDE